MASSKIHFPKDSPTKKIKKANNGRGKLTKKIDEVFEFSSDSDSSPKASEIQNDTGLNVSNVGDISSCSSVSDSSSVGAHVREGNVAVVSDLSARLQRVFANSASKAKKANGNQKDSEKKKRSKLGKHASKSKKGLAFKSGSESDKENSTYSTDSGLETQKLRRYENRHVYVNDTTNDISNVGNTCQSSVKLTTTDLTHLNDISSMSTFPQRDHSMSTAYPEMSGFQRLVEDDSVHVQQPSLANTELELHPPAQSGGQTHSKEEHSDDSFISACSTEEPTTSSDHLNKAKRQSDDVLPSPGKVNSPIQLSVADNPGQCSEQSLYQTSLEGSLSRPNSCEPSFIGSPETRDMSLQISLACSLDITENCIENQSFGNDSIVSPEMKNMSIQASMACSPKLADASLDDTESVTSSPERPEVRNISLQASMIHSPEVKNISLQASLTCSPDSNNLIPQLKEGLPSDDSDVDKNITEMYTTSLDVQESSLQEQREPVHFSPKKAAMTDERDNCTSLTPKLLLLPNKNGEENPMVKPSSVTPIQKSKTKELFNSDCDSSASKRCHDSTSKNRVGTLIKVKSNNKTNSHKKKNVQNYNGENHVKVNSKIRAHKALDFSDDSDFSPKNTSKTSVNLPSALDSHSQLHESIAGIAVTDLSVRLQSILSKSQPNTKTRHNSGPKPKMKKTKGQLHKDEKCLNIQTCPSGKNINEVFDFSDDDMSSKHMSTDEQKATLPCIKENKATIKSKMSNKMHKALDFSSDSDTSPSKKHDHEKSSSSDTSKISVDDSSSSDVHMLSMRLNSLLLKSKTKGHRKHGKHKEFKTPNVVESDLKPHAGRSGSSNNQTKYQVSAGSTHSDISQEKLRLPKRLSSVHDLDYTVAENVELPQCESTRLSLFGSPENSSETLDSTGESCASQSQSTWAEAEEKVLNRFEKLMLEKTPSKKQSDEVFISENSQAGLIGVENAKKGHDGCNTKNLDGGRKFGKGMSPTSKNINKGAPSEHDSGSLGEIENTGRTCAETALLKVCSNAQDKPECFSEPTCIQDGDSQEDENQEEGNMSLYVTVCENPPSEEKEDIEVKNPRLEESVSENSEADVKSKKKGKNYPKKALLISSSDESEFEIGNSVPVSFAENGSDSEEEYDNGGSLTEFRGQAGGFQQNKPKSLIPKKRVCKAWNSGRTSSSDDDFLPDLPSAKKNSASKATLRGARAAIEISDDSEDDLDNFLTRLKTPAPKSKPQTRSVEEFIVSDDDVSDESSGEENRYSVRTKKKIATPSNPLLERSTNSPYGVEEYLKDPKSLFVRPKSTLPVKHTLLTQTPGRYVAKPTHSSFVATVKSSETRSHSTGDLPQFFNFLQSLSTDVAEHRRHPDAARFVKGFKRLKEELTKKLFDLYNETVFDHQLPHDFRIEWNGRLLKTAGFCAYKRTGNNRTARVELSVKVCDSAERVRDTLIHELCHAVVWLVHGVNDGHGRWWKHWAGKANRAHPDLPVILRCHSYEINTKYIYKCSSCGYQIGRHSKSLDTTKKVCGYCRSPFQLLVNGKNGPINTPKTPRTPNKFALFVKENYGSVKKQTPGIKHKDVMAALSVEFAAKNKIGGSV